MCASEPDLVSGCCPYDKLGTQGVQTRQWLAYRRAIHLLRLDLIAGGISKAFDAIAMRLQDRDNDLPVLFPNGLGFAS